MDTHAKRYLKEFGSSMAAYTVMVLTSIWLLRGHDHSPLRYFFAGLPHADAIWVTPLLILL